MNPPIFQWLKASQDVKAIVGTNPPRIWNHGSAPQTPDGQARTEPYITWFVVALAPENNLSDPVPVDRIPVQVDCWHLTSAGITLLAEAVRDALEPNCVMTGLVADSREMESRYYRIALTFDVWHGRPVPSSI